MTGKEKVSAEKEVVLEAEQIWSNFDERLPKQACFIKPHK